VSAFNRPSRWRLDDCSWLHTLSAILGVLINAIPTIKMFPEHEVVAKVCRSDVAAAQ